MKDRKSVVWRIIHTSAWMRVLIYFVLFALLILIYTIIFHRLYPQLEGTPVDWSQSVLFVIQTITTTGSLLTYHSDEMILISSIMMLSGVIMIFMVIPLILTPYLVAMLRSGPARRTPRALFHHTVIVGNGELSRALVESLSLSDKEVLLVEEDETAARELARKHRHGAFVIWGDYDDPQTWEQAWIKNADFVILCENERTTASIILGIRGLTSARIISIVDKISFDRYLMYAGAEYVLSPKQVTGRILARHAVLNPAGDTEPAIPGLDRLTINKDEFPEKTLRLIHIPVMPESNAAGKKLGELDLYGQYGITAPFIWKAGRFISRPESSETIDTTTSLFLFGRVDTLRRAVHEELEVDKEQIGHAVIAGFGDVGSAAYTEMVASGISCVVVDAKKYDVNEVVGNAEDEGVLREARIEEARFCIVALNNDDVNIFTTLMARNLNPGIRILARANEPSSVEKLYRAGADYVALLPRIGGQTVGRIVLADTITVLVDLPDGEVVVLKQVRHSTDMTVGSAGGASGVRFLGIEAPDRVIIAPQKTEALREGDSVIVAGNIEQLKRFIRLF
ncbi:TrkA family potassium uptake protein [Methanoregula sp.]|jgi:Trk K+ transport system NAD-binding subunit|uniref:potassium channel family protein n=1 Tax=Methanoregula sp. TaxID=2052170 RepID=UPI0025F6A981|nr:NAD-binding protein [Methanoregula sp.]